MTKGKKTIENIVGKRENAGNYSFFWHKKNLQHLIYIERAYPGSRHVNKLSDKKQNWKHLQTTKQKRLKFLNLLWDRWKTLWEREKMPVTSIFLIPQCLQRAYFSTQLKILCKKEKNAGNQHFLHLNCKMLLNGFHDSCISSFLHNGFYLLKDKIQSPSSGH